MHSWRCSRYWWSSGKTEGEFWNIVKIQCSPSAVGKKTGGTPRYGQEIETKRADAIKGRLRGCEIWDGEIGFLLLEHGRLVADDWRIPSQHLLGRNQSFFLPEACGYFPVVICDCFLPCTTAGQFVTSVLWALTVASTFVWVMEPHPTTAIVTLASPWMKTRRHVQVKTDPLTLFHLVGQPRSFSLFKSEAPSGWNPPGVPTWHQNETILLFQAFCLHDLVPSHISLLLESSIGRRGGGAEVS